MPTDRAQDTEAIRAARERLRRACEDGERLYRKRMHAEPTIADDNRIDGILTYDLSDGLGAYDRLVARLEAAERHERALRAIAAICTPEKHVPFIDRVAEIRRTARAALAAAAPGETTAAGPGCERHKGSPHNLCEACWALEPDPATLSVTQGGIGRSTAEFSAAPGETEQTP